MVTEDDDAATELRPGRGDSRVHLLIGKTKVLLRERLAFADVVFFVFREQRDQHAGSPCCARLCWACETFRKGTYQYTPGSRLKAYGLGRPKP